MTIDGLAFVACARSSVVQAFYPEKTYYGLHLQSVPMAEIIDCTFQDSYGTAPGIVDSHVVLRDNNFFNNCRLCSNGRCDGYNYRGPICYGGSVFVQRSNLNITGSTFFVNSATDGGGVCAQYSSNVDINGNTIFNSASYGNGGGVRAKNSNVYISGNTTFTGNSGTDGGGMSAWENSNVYINGHTTDRCVYIACTLYEHTKTATWQWPLPLLQPFSLSSV